MKPNLSIRETQLQLVSIELDKLLADEFILHTKTRNYYWDIQATNFYEMRQFMTNKLMRSIK
ncbi:hypothetical protein [Lacibacter sediminis]|uniref:hypothetical protein n=1 Tax=Lacibacter sediminis TaxID=2760713 RepID=UPI001C7226A6|nr:hypothetical protein [Lacibacter sediminis]